MLQDSNPLIVPADICTALNSEGVIGSKVLNHQQFFPELRAAISTHDFAADRIPGQGFIAVPGAIPWVSCGVGKPVEDVSAYTLRLYRGRVTSFLKREHAASTENLHCVVYTRQAYFDDPDITAEEMARIVAVDLLNGRPVTHVLVAVLASAGPQSQLGTYRFTANLAGGNHEAQVWTADEIRAKARSIVAYNQAWQTVAD